MSHRDNRLPSFLGRIRARLPGGGPRGLGGVVGRGDAAALHRAAGAPDPDRAAVAMAALARIEPPAALDRFPVVVVRPEAVVRRASLRGLAEVSIRGVPPGPEAIDAARALLSEDRRREVQLAAAMALHAAGAPGVREWLLSLGEERMETCFGVEEVAALMDFDPPGAALRLAQVLRPGEGLPAWRTVAEGFREGGGEITPRGVEESAAARARLRASAGAGVPGREDWEAVLGLAALGDPRDFDLLVGRYRSAPGPGRVQAVKALGYLGDPRAVPLLGARIFDDDADPELSFALRRHCANALGRVGSPRALSALLPAMRWEEDHWEGRPGAGCGVIFPVRANVLWALGEIGDPRAAEEVAYHLADESGPTSGGFYLYAMDALLKMGRGAVPGIERAVAHGPRPTSEERGAAGRMRKNADVVLDRLR